TVAEDDRMAGHCGHARSGRENADDIEWIYGRDGDFFIFDAKTPHSAKRVDRFGERKLFAGRTGDETSAADLPTRLEPPVDAHQLAPRRCGALAGEQRAHDDP